ncbi:trihelix transcription factor ASIL2-like [Silene latifolia]|uniref:trihelix transcription factor ASIL2-like n=1 Tax=Silene latifolia TaxID=37657 RepID=UPI003D7886CE
MNNYNKQKQPHSGQITADVSALYAGGRDDIWTDDSTSVLINAWAHRYVELRRGNVSYINWNEISAIVKYCITPKTEIQCKNRIDAVINKYKFEKSKVLAGCGPSYWPFYDRLDRIIAPVQKEVPVGIPFGIPQPLPLPLPFPQQVIRHCFPFPTPFSVQQRFNLHSTVNHNHNFNVSVGNVGGMRPAVIELDSDSESDSEKECWLPNESKKRQRVEMNVGSGGSGRKKGKEKKTGMEELMTAIGRFGEAYEAAERGKLEDIVEMERQRMVFVKEMEIQRIESLMKMQLEFFQLNRGGGGRRNSGGGRINL